MKFTILSHAGMLIEAAGTKLVCDPWILGSCHWRSWWNYPKAAEFRKDDVNFIYLTHLHWDHFHGPSLRKFPKSATILVPAEPSTRMMDDLVGFGFAKIIELPHGKTHTLAPGLRVTSYQFGLALDSVLVVDDGCTVLVNMNDCKIRGLSLRYLIKRHPKVDFLFRSHSSAQAYPVCVEASNLAELRYRTNEDYMEDFIAATRLVRPRYAIPFASNHCFLHKETRHFNDTVVSPIHVKRSFDRNKPAASECVVMVPGDSWDSQRGFHLQEHTFFSDRDRHLDEYAAEVAPILEDYYRKEDAVQVPFGAFEHYFRGLMDSLPWFSRFLFKPVVAFQVRQNPQTLWVLDFEKKEIFEAPSGSVNYSFRITVHASVLWECVVKGMFTVFTPSKRLAVHANEGGVKDFFIFSQLLELYEYGFLPLRKCFSSRSLRSWALRWRELVDYSSAVLRALWHRGSSDPVREFVPRISA